MTDDLEGRRATLEQRLAEKRGETERQAKLERRGDQSGIALAVKLSSEFIAGVVVGAGLGWVIDHFAGSSPWGMIIFLFLGFLAGVLNVMRATGAVAPKGANGNSADGAPKV
jgi:ATP synthase protein I